MHGFDELTPVEETLETLDTLVRSGKVRYIAGSNFSGWHPMKSLAISQRYGWAPAKNHSITEALNLSMTQVASHRKKDLTFPSSCSRIVTR